MNTKGTVGNVFTGNVVMLRDACNNDITSGGHSDRFSASVRGADNSELDVSVVDNDDGTYAFHFTPEIAQTYTLTVLFDVTPINSGSNTVF